MSEVRPIIRNRLMATLAAEDVEYIIARSSAVDLKQGVVIYETGAMIEHVYFMQRGLGSVLTTMTNGSRVEVRMIGAEGLLGLSALLGGERSDEHVVIQIAGDALRVSAPPCQALFDRSVGFRRAALTFANQLLATGSQTAACNRLHTLDQRCARWLLMSSDRTQSDYLPLTQEYLSAMLGVRRAGVTEAAGSLQRLGLIKYRHGQITIVDRNGLKGRACECYRLDHERFIR